MQINNVGPFVPQIVNFTADDADSVAGDQQAKEVNVLPFPQAADESTESPVTEQIGLRIANPSGQTANVHFDERSVPSDVAEAFAGLFEQFREIVATFEQQAEALEQSSASLETINEFLTQFEGVMTAFQRLKSLAEAKREEETIDLWA